MRCRAWEMAGCDGAYPLRVGPVVRYGCIGPVVLVCLLRQPQARGTCGTWQHAAAGNEEALWIVHRASWGPYLSAPYAVLTC